MSNNYSQRLNTLLGDILHDKFGWDDLQRVVNFEEDIEYGGYCSTCSYESTVLDVTYDTKYGDTVTKRWHGALSDLTSQM